MRAAWFLVVLLTGATAAAAAPCFPDEKTISAHDQRLRRFEAWFGDDDKVHARDGKLGTCDAVAGVIREGTQKVAAVHCGVEVYVPGIVDDRGSQVGERGSTILKRYGDAAASRIMCMPGRIGWRVMTQCTLIPRDGDSPWRYYVRGRWPERCPGVTDDRERRQRGCDEPLVGDAAIDFFWSQRVFAMMHVGSCH